MPSDDLGTAEKSASSSRGPMAAPTEDPGRPAAHDRAVTDANDVVAGASGQRSSGDDAIVARRVEVLARVGSLLKELDARRHAKAAKS